MIQFMIIFVISHTGEQRNAFYAQIYILHAELN